MAQFQVSYLKDLSFKHCQNAPKLLANSKFVPITEVEYKKLYDPSRTKLILKKLDESQSFGVKLWTFKPGTEILGHSKLNTTFYALAKEKCPITFKTCNKNNISF